MDRKPTLYWNEKLVMMHLSHAASIHRRLPEPYTPGFHSLWPDTLVEEWQRLYDAINGKNTLGPPYASEVDYHEQIMEWLRILERPQQQLCWMRANAIHWAILVEEFGRCKRTLWGRMNEGLYSIALHLNRIDPQGDHFRQIREKANAVNQHW